jgi:glycosyltransferase involved in cell wall biosynthesis
MSSSRAPNAPIQVGIFYHADPLGHVPGGIDSFIRGLIQCAPEDISYTLVGASSDVAARPVGREIQLELGSSPARFVPVMSLGGSSARQSRIPHTVQYILGLRRIMRLPIVSRLQVLDFHRIEPVLLFRSDPRPMNVFMHNDMAVTRDKATDMRWRHAPWLYDRMEGWLLRRVERVLAVRQTAVERYRNSFPEMAAKFTFTPTSVDTSLFQPASESALPGLRVALRQRLGWNDGARLLVFVGRLDSQKDPLLLLRAFANTVQRHPEAQLVFIGDGQLRGALESLISELGLTNRTRLLGALPRAEIAAILRASDLFVLSSAYEGMPIAVLEALCSGVPVVSTKVGEIPMAVRDGVNGYLATERTAEAICAALTTALENLSTIRGTPCTLSVKPYHPEQVYGAIYDHHRAQAHRQSMGELPS